MQSGRFFRQLAQLRPPVFMHHFGGQLEPRRQILQTAAEGNGFISPIAV
jgi:hypothetical protein